MRDINEAMHILKESSNNEVNQTVISGDNITVDLDVIIKEAINFLNYKTHASITNYNINDNKITLMANGSNETISILKDRLGVKEDSKSLSNNKVDKLKSKLTELLKKNFKEDFKLSLKSIDGLSSIVFIYFKLEMPSILAEISINYKIYEDGYQTLGYIIKGDISKDETWSATSCSPNELVNILKRIQEYYNTKSTLPEGNK